MLLKPWSNLPDPNAYILPRSEAELQRLVLQDHVLRGIRDASMETQSSGRERPEGQFGLLGHLPDDVRRGLTLPHHTGALTCVVRHGLQVARNVR